MNFVIVIEFILVCLNLCDLFIGLSLLLDCELLEIIWVYSAHTTHTLGTQLFVK